MAESFGRDATAMQGAEALRSEERASPSKKKRAQSDKVFLSPSLSLDTYAAAAAPQSIGDWCLATREGYTIHIRHTLVGFPYVICGGSREKIFQFVFIPFPPPLSVFLCRRGIFARAATEEQWVGRMEREKGGNLHFACS